MEKEKIRFGEFIREKRKKVGLTMTELAKKVGVSITYISIIEKGKEKTYNKELTEKIKKALKLSISEEKIYEKLLQEEQKNHKLAKLMQLSNEYYSTGKNNVKQKEIKNILNISELDISELNEDGIKILIQIIEFLNLYYKKNK